MGVRYTGTQKYVTDIRSDTAAHFIADMDALLVAVGCPRAAVTGGFKYTFISPEDQRMKLWIQDLGDASAQGAFIRFSPSSHDEERFGYLAAIIHDGRTYEAWANGCQLFIAPLGDSGTQSFVSFACGTLAMPPNVAPTCTQGVVVPDVSECWWSSCSGSGSFGGAGNFRNARYATGAYTLCYNGALYLAAGNVDGQFLFLSPICSAINVDASYGSPAAALKYGSQEPMRVDALLSQSGQVYGQLWDAFLRCKAEDLDSIFEHTEKDEGGNDVTTRWVAWNNSVPPDPNGGGGTVLATLYLLVEISGGVVGNVVY